VDVSIIIPCRNGAALLPTMLSSLKANGAGKVREVIVVDDQSTDNTVRVAEEWRNRLPLRVISMQRQSGRCASRNTGVRASRGEALLFLDHDDAISPGYIAAMESALRDADLVGGRLDVHRLNPPWLAESRPNSAVDGLLDHFDFLPYVPSCAMGIRRTVFEAVGGFAADGAEDVDLSWRVQLKGHRIADAPGALLHYRYRSDLGSLLRQAVIYGADQPLLYRRFREAGMPGRSAKRVWSAWRGLLHDALRVRTKGSLASVAFLLGVYVGRIRGSVRHRVLYL
jgi:glycosyltransferase involved in cell wall biosynthesis